MRLSHLDQKIPLNWGEAGQLAEAIADMLCGWLEAGQPQPLEIVLSMGLLVRVRGRLISRQRLEHFHHGPLSKKPWRLTLRYDEVAALMLILPTAPLAGQAWGEIQRVSLSLDHFIDFGQPLSCSL
ncbi:MAG: hypothetical protein EOO63_06835 [Hymenobacter sp.]|nr:MAG: hypothetical protein EOO63_06835 [Hymenobacter sp.]